MRKSRRKPPHYTVFFLGRVVSARNKYEKKSAEN
jgi:hypothetical protein